jgi:drug/metabolite transporter (DMT)-like permease
MKHLPGPRARAYAAIVPSMIFFALSFVWFKVANVSYGPLTIIFLRLVLSSILLLVFNRFSRQLVLPRRGDWWLLCLLGFFEPFLYFVFESYGLQLLSSTVAAVIISTIPLVSPLAAFLFLRERVHGRHILCVAVSFAGVAIVVLQRGGGVSVSLLGVLLQFGAVCSAVAYTVVLHKIPLRLNTLSVILYQNFVGTVLFAPLWVLFESRRFVATPVDYQGLMAILKLSMVVSTLAFILFSYSVRRLGINRANMFINMIPVFTALFAWHILGETLTLQKSVGIAIVIGGLFLAERLRVRENAIIIQGA